MAKTHILILFTWTLLQAASVCDTANTCVAVRACDNAQNIKSLESKTDKLQASLDSMAKQNADLTSQLQDLKRDVGLKVAFSASFAGTSAVTVGRGSPQTIVFKNVFFNNGDAYTPHTGIFSAPLKGAYQFTFRTRGTGSYYSGAKLVKNGQPQVSTYQHIGRDEGTSQAVILSLNAKDTVNVITLGSSYRVYDDSNHHTTFSGFLLFPL